MAAGAGRRGNVRPEQLLITAHTNETGQYTTVSSTVNVSDTAGFHTYGLLWTQDELVWTYDGVKVAEAATPSDMHCPMYMLVDLAIGGQPRRRTIWRRRPR